MRSQTPDRDIHLTAVTRIDYTRLSTVEVIGRIALNRDKNALDHFLERRKIFYQGGRWQLLSECILDLCRTTIPGNYYPTRFEDREEFQHRVYEQTLRRFIHVPPADDVASLNSYPDAVTHYRKVHDGIHSWRAEHPDASALDEEQAAGNLFKRRVLIYFKYSLKESYREVNPLQKRYAWHVGGGTIDLYHPTWISGREFSAWLKANIDAPDPKQPGEKHRIQTQVDRAFATGAFVLYDSAHHATHMNPDNEEPGESHPATNTLAWRVALKKALEIESLRPAIRALGKDAVHRLVLRILHDLADGCYHTTPIIQEFGLSKAALSRFAGISWNRPSGTNTQTAIPDLWRNVASVVMAEPAFLETAATVGVTRIIETVMSSGKGTNDA